MLLHVAVGSICLFRLLSFPFGYFMIVGFVGFGCVEFWCCGCDCSGYFGYVYGFGVGFCYLLLACGWLVGMGASVAFEFPCVL